MAEIGNRVYIDSWNYFQLNGQEIEVDTANNRSKVSVWLDLHVTSGGHVNSSGISAGVNEKSVNLGYQYYGPGTHTLVGNDIWVWHNSDGSGTAVLNWWFSAYIGNWSGSGTLGLTKINRQASINSFTGTTIGGNFNATFNSTSGSYNYKLRISVPNKVELQKFSNYTSGTNVTLSDSAVATAKQYSSDGIIQIGGVIETYSGSTKIGESSEIVINVTANKGYRIRVNGQWKEAVPYVRVNGAWKEATAYIRVNGTWKEGI